MSGGIPLLSLYAFMAWRGETLSLLFTESYKPTNALLYTIKFYAHGTVHLGNTSFIKYQRDATFSVYLVFITLHVSDAVCVHHQE